MPLFLKETDGVEQALRRAKNVFGAGNWSKAYKRIEEAIGPIDKMLTDGDEDAWQHWQRHASEIRGSVVHGDGEISIETAEWAIAYVEQLQRQLVLRMIVSAEHPANAVVIKVIESLRRTMKRPPDDDQS